MDWQVITSRPASGSANMELDLQLFRDFELKKIKPTLRTYSWQPPCISLGYAQKIKDEIDVAKAEALGWDVVKRPTGGGIVFHNTAEVTYSLVMAIDDPVLPKGLVPSYRKISEAIVMALKELGVDAEIRNTKYETLNKSEIRNSKVLNQLCFSYPAEYEVVVDGKKIVGSAQKRGRVALLQQGSIFVRATPEEHLKVLKKPHAELNAISLEEVLGRQVEHAEVAAALVKGFSSLF